MAWKIEYLDEAVDDLSKLDHSQLLHVLKAIEKVSKNPLPSNEGGLGKPLGHHSALQLTGYMKIKLLNQGLRVVYRLVREYRVMRIIVISVRNDDQVCKLAQKRIEQP